jgi:TolB-like protein/Tfp pilus assembly protein PilF/tRNA A-37 threonylcarbamoyl transferase component Bud32
VSLYAVDRELGKGGMATVYLAQDVKHDRVVALKVLHADLSSSVGPDRFLREIKLAARLNHPHILPLFDSGEADGVLYYVMPYVEGESLRERLTRDGPLPVDEAIHLARAIAAALDYAHRQSVIHRDIKPENVMLHEHEAMVMDFGIAKAMSLASDDTLTQMGVMLGTPAYVSPEQAAGEELDHRSDQFSLACVLYEMLAGERPFTGPTTQAVLAKRFIDTVKPLRTLRATVPESIETVVRRAMSIDREDRFSTTGQFANALGSGTLTTPDEIWTVAAPTVSAAKSVAVLPFANMSAEAENEYFTDGMADEIIGALARVRALRVASRTSSFAFKGKLDDIGEIGRKLKVSTVLEGSVRKMGNRLRISAQLVNVADGYHLWSERYDREMQDVFAIQDEIAHAIVEALRVILSEGEKRAIAQPRTVNIQAYDYYLRGRQYIHQTRRRSLEYARQMFNRAIEIDPGYALAYAGVADASSLLYTYHEASDANRDQADNASRRALELAPDRAEAHVARAMAATLNRGYEEAEHEFEAAMRLDPKLFEAAYFFGRTRKAQGRLADAARLFERALAIRPDDYQSPGFLADVYTQMGKPAEALEVRQRMARVVEHWLELNPDDPRACVLGAINLAALGDRDGAQRLATRATTIDPDDPMLLYNVACMHSKLGNVDEALSHLERAVRRGGGNSRDWLVHDRDLDTIRESPRFQAILDAM